MKEQWSISKDKLVSIEDGLICNEETPYIRPTVQTDTCKKLIQCVKFMLYLELLLFVGWGCYAIWQTYRVESMEVKVTDSTQESVSRNLRDQRLHLEESTITPVELLTQMENLLQAENVLTKTVDTLQKQLDDDEINTETIEDPDSRLQNARESGIRIKSSPLTEINVPEMIVVDSEKNVANNEPEEGSDLSKSEETVVEWSFGLLLFPGTYNIKDRSQIITSDESEQSKPTENLSENDDNIDSVEADKLIDEIAKVLRDAKSEEPDENMASSYQRIGIDDSLSKMGAFSLPSSPMLTRPAELENPDSGKDVSDETNVREDMNGKGLVHIILRDQEPVTEIQDDFVRENPMGEYVDSQVDESTLLDATTDEVQEDGISFLGEFVNNSEDDSQVDPPSWMTTDEILVSPVLFGSEFNFYGNPRLIDKRSISNALIKDEALWKNKRVDSLTNKPKEKVIYDRDHLRIL